MKPQTFLIILGSCAVLLILWNLFSPLTLRQRPTPTGSLSSIAGQASGERVIGPDKIYFPGLTNEETVILGLTDHGQYFTRITRATGEIQWLMTEPISYAPDGVAYAPDGHAAITWQRTRGGALPGQATLYLFAEKKIIDLSPRIHDVVWLPSGHRILYLYADDRGGHKLAEANPDGSEWVNLLDPIPLRDPAFTLSPDGSSLLLTEKYGGWEPDDHNASLALAFPLYRFDRESKQLTDLPPKGIIAPLWSPDNARIAFLQIHEADLLGYLTLFNLADHTEQATTITTLPGKFVWEDTRRLLAASPNPSSPEEIASGITLANQDRLWRVTVGQSEPQPITTIQTSPPLDTLLPIRNEPKLLFRRFNYLFEVSLNREKN